MLVVIGIIATLVGMGAVSYSTAQKKSRDAKRKTDLKTIQNAMEQYYSICGYQYPTSVSSGIICPTGSVNIMPTIPTDPRTTTPYPMPTAAASVYQFCTTLESESSTSYCVSNQQ